MTRHKPGSAAEDVLAAHRPEIEYDLKVDERKRLVVTVAALSCSCGYATKPDDRQADFEAHQASALAAAGVLR